MKIAQKYSHLNGEEYLIVHHKKLYKGVGRPEPGEGNSQCLQKVGKEGGGEAYRPDQYHCGEY